LLGLVGIQLIAARVSEEREETFKKMVTSQVNDSNDLTRLFLKHSRSDKATEAWTNHKRYPKPTPYCKKADTAIGVHMFLNYVETFDVPEEPFDEVFYEECRAYDEERFLSKGSKTLFAIKERADPHWDYQWADVFMKAQLITKPGTEDRLAKPGALIFSFNTQTNFDYGALARYMSARTAATSRANVFSISEHTDADLSAHARKHMDFSIDSDESDYKAFDQSMTYPFTVVDLLSMHRRGIPAHIRLAYDFFTTHIRSHLGPMVPMMATGFKFTFIFNTERSKAYQATRFRLDKTKAYYGSGDDVVRNGHAQERETWDLVKDDLKLEAVESVNRYPIFCGWIMAPPGCIKSPELLLHRTAAKIERSDDFSFLYGYMADATPLHTNLELFLPYLSASQLEAHFTTVDLLRRCARYTGRQNFGHFVERFGLKRLFSLA